MGVRKGINGQAVGEFYKRAPQQSPRSVTRHASRPLEASSTMHSNPLLA